MEEPHIAARPDWLPLSESEYDLMRRALIRQTSAARVEQGYAHALDVAGWCVRVARKRSLDEHIACLTGFFHDVYYYAKGLRPLHALNSAEQVEKLHHPVGGESRFYRMCARYVSDHLFTAIRAEEMARALGYTRGYLCTRFKQEAGISLIRYIQKEKTAEAKRLLQFTDQDLGQIAALLDFSSQSHFQTVFRKITGQTPMAYRRRTRITI